MPITELLGVQVDMQLLLKLSFSVAAVLLVSWAYKFYNSREAKRIQLCAGDEKEQGKATCKNCKTTLQSQSSPSQDTEDGAKRSDRSEETLRSSANNEASSGGKQSKQYQSATKKDVDDEAKQSKPGILTYESTKEILQYPTQQIHDTETDGMTLRHRSSTNLQSRPSGLFSKSTTGTPECRSSQINNMDNEASQSKPGDTKKRQSSPNDSRDYKSSDAQSNGTKAIQQGGSSPNQNTDNLALHSKPGESISIKETSKQLHQSLSNYVTEDGSSQSTPEFDSTKETRKHQSLPENGNDERATQPKHGDETSTRHLQSLSSNVSDYGTKPGPPAFISTKETQQRQGSPNNDRQPKHGDLTSKSNNEMSTQLSQSLLNYVTEDGTSQSKPDDKINSKETLQHQSSTKNVTGATQTKQGDLTSKSNKETSTQHLKSLSSIISDDGKPFPPTFISHKDTQQRQNSPKDDMDFQAKKAKPGAQMFDSRKKVLTEEHSSSPSFFTQSKPRDSTLDTSATQPKHGDGTLTQHLQSLSSNFMDDGIMQPKPFSSTFITHKDIKQRQNPPNNATDFQAKKAQIGALMSESTKKMLTKEQPSSPSFITQSKPGESMLDETKKMLSSPNLATDTRATQPKHDDETVTQHLQSLSSTVSDDRTTQPKPFSPTFSSHKDTQQRQSSPNNDTEFQAKKAQIGALMSDSTKKMLTKEHPSSPSFFTQSKPGDSTFDGTKKMLSSPNYITDARAMQPKHGDETSTRNEETSMQHQNLSSNIFYGGKTQPKPCPPTFITHKDTQQRQSSPNSDTEAMQSKYGDETLTQHLKVLSSNISDDGTTQLKLFSPTSISHKDTQQRQSSPNDNTDFREMLTKQNSPSSVTQSKPGDLTLDGTKKMLSSPNFASDNKAEQIKSGTSKSMEICKNLPADTELKKSKPGDLKSDDTKENPTMPPPSKAEQSRDAFSMSNSGRNISMKGDMLPLQKQTEDATRNISSGSALNLPLPAESGTAGATGRRSPCFLQKLEGGMGVGRELRQDLERQGAYSCFLSKAEIKVEDANVLLEGKEQPVVRGKIYDYYVESSSHSITDREFERKCESQLSCGADSPSALHPIIMRDLVVQQNAAEDPSSPRSPPSRPILLRKESYLSAAEQSELPSPTRMTHSLTSAGDEAITVYHMILSATEREAREALDLGASRSQTPALQEADLEELKSKLDLGNCLDALCLAKRHGQAAVQQAALGVMSDNYLQVLMDPNLYGRLLAGEREQIRKQRMKGRRFVMVADMDPQDWVRSPGVKPSRTSSAVYCYDDYKDSWHRLCLVPQEVISKACAICTMDNYLFVAVGCQGAEREMLPSKRVFCFNPLTSIWKEISPMNEARPRCKLAALEGYIYAIGGECLSSVERYDPRLDRWTFVAPLPNDTFAVAHHVTASNGELFVSGGTLKSLLLRYSPKTNAWRPSRVVSSKDRTADLVAVGRFLYRFDVNPLLGVSVYRYHTVARLWYECSSRRIQRCPAFQCVNIDGTVYCVSRHFTMKFDADEVSPAFVEEDLSVLSAAKGVLYPFVLSLPDKTPRQTSV